MGEKEIVADPYVITTPGSGTPLGGTTTGGGSTTGGGGPSTIERPKGPPGIGPVGAGGPTTQEKRDPCKDLTEQAQSLLKQLEGLQTQNREQMQRALRAFFGEKGTNIAGGYAHWATQAKMTEAVVDSNNAVGKMLIDIGMFAAGGPGGLTQLGSTGKFAKAANKVFGSGLLGAESTVDAYTKIGLKVVEKVASEAGEKYEGKAATTGYKTIEKALGEHPGKAYQPTMSTIESIIRDKAIDAIGDWMKQGAMEGDLGRARDAYAAFLGAGAAANVSAAAAAAIHEQLTDLNKQLEANDCPQVAIPDYIVYTFDLSKFGQGASTGENGPRMHAHPLEHGVDMNYDLFANVKDPRGLPY